jgi:hypothetical protein
MTIKSRKLRVISEPNTTAIKTRIILKIFSNNSLLRNLQKKESCIKFVLIIKIQKDIQKVQ